MSDIVEYCEILSDLVFGAACMLELLLRPIVYHLLLDSNVGLVF